MSKLWWGLAIVGFLVAALVYCLCAISGSCSRQEEAMERALAGKKDVEP